MKPKLVKPAAEAHTSEFYDRHAHEQIANLHALAVGFMLGPDKVAADLSEMVRNMLLQQFAQWVASDSERVRRYDALDTKLVNEFWVVFRDDVFNPVLQRFGAMEPAR